MDSSWFSTFFGDEHGTDFIPHLAALGGRVLLSVTLGVLVAFRPWRLMMRGVPAPNGRLSQAQALMTVVGAVTVIVIGGSPARAFGLVGLGSFVRFRSGITDPRESVVLLMMIGIGMACGVGLPVEAMGAAVLVSFALFFFDIMDRVMEQRARVLILAASPTETRLALVQAFHGINVLDESSSSVDVGKASGQLIIELPVRGTPDAAKLRDEFERRNIPGIRRVALVMVE